MVQLGWKRCVIHTCLRKIGETFCWVFPIMSNGSVWKSSEIVLTQVKYRHKGICALSFFPVVSRFLRVWISRKMKGSSQHPIWHLIPSLKQAWLRTSTRGMLCLPMRPARRGAGNRLDGMSLCLDMSYFFPIVWTWPLLRAQMVVIEAAVTGLGPWKFQPSQCMTLPVSWELREMQKRKNFQALWRFPPCR